MVYSSWLMVSLRIYQVLLCLMKPSMCGAQDLVSFHPNNWDSIGRYERLEIGIKLPDSVVSSITKFLSGGAGVNPYDFEQLKVSAEFNDRNGVQYKREGFYFHEISIDTLSDMYRPAPSRYPLRVRIAPMQTGSFTFSIVVRLNDRIISILKGNFNVVECGRKGPLRIGQTGHLMHTDRTQFFAIGQAIPFCDYPGALIRPSAFQNQRSYIKDLADNSGNFFRLRLDPWSNELEFEEAGVYGSARTPGENYQRQWHAFELDETFRQAEERGVFIFLTLLNDVHFHDEKAFGWKANPYKDIAKHVSGFFDIKGGAFRLYKNKIRYFLARYGYSANLAVISLINETDQIAGYRNDWKLRQAIDSWAVELADFMRYSGQSPDHLLTSGYSDAPVFPDRGAKVTGAFDITTTNHYSNSRRVIKHRHDDKPQGVSGDKRPFIYGEIGTGLCGPTHEDWFSDADFHNAVWSTAMFAQAIGNGMYWWDWEQASHLEPHDVRHPGIDHRRNFRALRTFFYENPVPFGTEKFVSAWACDQLLFERLSKRHIEWIGNVNEAGTKGYGWVHNSDYFWINDPVRLTGKNCPGCIGSGMEFFYDSECYQERDSEVPFFNEPKGPYGFAHKEEDVVLSGYQAFRVFNIEIWSCYNDGGLITSFSKTAGIDGKIRFKRSVGRWPGDKDFGDPDFAFKVSIADQRFAQVFQVFPNPAENCFRITGNADISAVTVLDMNGERIREVRGHASQACEICTEGLPAGMYVLLIRTTDNFLSYLKVIKK